MHFVTDALRVIFHRRRSADINIYAAETAVFDQFMYNNNEFLIIVAGGNIGDNNKKYTVGTPATGKNILADKKQH